MNAPKSEFLFVSSEVATIGWKIDGKIVLRVSFSFQRASSSGMSSQGNPPVERGAQQPRPVLASEVEPVTVIVQVHASLLNGFSTVHYRWWSCGHVVFAAMYTTQSEYSFVILNLTRSCALECIYEASTVRSMLMC